jgi:ABC-type thiamine transport system ATPase subunit
MSSLEKMLKKMKEEPVDHSQPLLLLDEAFVAINNDELSFAEKKTRIDKLEQQAKGYELTCFADAHEALMVTASMDDLSALNESEQD